ncbi:cobalamin-dependent protein [Acidimicrobiia bacterium EGI L10123]|uniref:cobalamin B12-binding domain-containing protein n=1 Tax=Salinilacustrithrix flava TaxID=2957203 RepID=UPI003D7C202F|nr:cobalamin-dependent protein [Acidimicrobiia bacterium EGI L10123]
MARPEPAAIIELIEARRRDELAGIVRELTVSEGLDAAIALLVEVQVDVGARWQSQAWTVADEHAASAIVDHALTVACAATGSPDDDRRVVVACAEDEWHVLPARMLSEQLRSRGWSTLFLGSSAPARELGRFVAHADPVAVGLSCSMDRNLPGARRSIEACHEAGVPVVVGGAAFDEPGRVAALGADASCATVAEVDELLEAWAEEPPVLASPTVEAPPHLDSLARHRVLDATLRSMVERIHPLADARPHELVRLQEDLDGLLRGAEAAAHVADPGIVADHVAWLRSVSEARGETPGLVGVALEALAGAAPEWMDLRGELSVEV